MNPNHRTARRGRVSMAIALTALVAAVSACDRRTPQPEVPAATTPPATSTPSTTTPPMPPASAASQ